MDKAVLLYEALAVAPPRELFLAQIMESFSVDRMTRYQESEFAARCMAAAIVVTNRIKLIQGRAGIEEAVRWIMDEVSRRNDIQATMSAIRGCRGKCGGVEIIKAIAEGDVPLLAGVAIEIGGFTHQDVERIFNEWKN